MNGVLIVNKEKGYTSRDVVNLVSRKLGIKRVGHTGTLDPLATGVLVLCVGKSLKLVELLMNHDKEYIAKIRLGVSTDTLDITGNVLATSQVKEFSEKEIEETLRKFVGKIRQEVPKYSAIKVNGKKLYEYARAGIEVALPIREVEIYDLKLIGDIRDCEFSIWCHVSKGTYIRSLVRDIGSMLGTCATMVELKRTKLGNFGLDQAVSIDDIREGRFTLLDPVEVLDLPQVVVDRKLEKKIRHGQVLERFFDGNMAMIMNLDQELLAIYQVRGDGYVKPYRMFV